MDAGSREAVVRVLLGGARVGPAGAGAATEFHWRSGPGVPDDWLRSRRPRTGLGLAGTLLEGRCGSEPVPRLRSSCEP